MPKIMKNGIEYGGGGRWDLIAQTSVTGTNITSVEQNKAYPEINLSNYNELLLVVSYYKSTDGYLNVGSVNAPVSEVNVVGSSEANWLTNVGAFGNQRADILVRDNVVKEIRATLLSNNYNHSGYTCYAKLFAR